ncbi:hypothetical protein OAM01_03100 [bacterium]|nr:hypothetical protein [bacterium]
MSCGSPLSVPVEVVVLMRFVHSVLRNDFVVKNNPQIFPDRASWSGRTGGRDNDQFYGCAFSNPILNIIMTAERILD